MVTQHQLIGWNEEKWNNLRNIAAQEITRVSRIKNLLGHQKLDPATRQVKYEVIDRTGPRLAVLDRQNISLIELSSTITIDKQQIDASDMSAIQLAVKEAAKDYARAVDIILLNGSQQLDNKPIPPGTYGSVNWPVNCTIYSENVNHGLRDFNPLQQDGKIAKTKNALDYPQVLISGITRAKSQLQAAGNEGPYVLVLSPQQFNAAVFPSVNLQLPITTIEKLLNSHGTIAGSAFTEGVIVESSGLDNNQAILFSPEQIEVSFTYDGELQITNPNEPVQMRLYGSFALRVKNPTAVTTITYNITRR